MNIDQLRDTLKIDEGVKYEIYNDHLGYPTFGIGHLVVESDEEHGKPVGPPVSEERVNELFDKDIQVTLDECTVLYDNFYTLPEEALLIIANMMFNLGRPRLSKFVRMRENVNKGDWKAAASEMRNSKWYDQVTKRAQRLIDRMENIST